MVRSTKTIMVTLIAVISMFVFTSKMNAQGYCYLDNWEMGAGSGWWNNSVPAQYALTADQISKINEIRLQSQKRIIPLQNPLRSLRIEMHGYASRYDADINKIKQYRNKIRDIEDKISDIRLETRDRISKLLTKEQQVYFNQGNYGWWDMGNGWWHMGHAMMNHGMMGGWNNRCW